MSPKHWAISARLSPSDFGSLSSALLSLTAASMQLRRAASRKVIGSVCFLKTEISKLKSAGVWANCPAAEINVLLRRKSLTVEVFVDAPSCSVRS